MYIITQEMKNKIQEMDKKNFKQWDYLKKAIPRIVHWSKKNNCKIYNIEYVPIFGEELDILIFYKTDLELEMFKTKKNHRFDQKRIYSNFGRNRIYN